MSVVKSGTALRSDGPADLGQQHSGSVRALWLLALVVGLVWGSPGFASAATPDSSCRSAFLQREYAKAARCFARLAKQQKATSDRLLQLQKGRWLDNAARAYQKAAVGMERDLRALTKLLSLAQRRISSVPVSQKPHLRWRRKVTLVATFRAEAARLIGLFLRQKLWATPQEAQGAKQRERRLLQAIPYSSLAVPSPHPRLSLCVWRLAANTPRQALGCQKPGQPWKRGGLLPGLYQIQASTGRLYTTQHKLFLAPGYALKWRIEGQHRLFLGDPRASVVWRDPLGIQRTQRGATFDKWLIPGKHTFVVSIPNDKPHKHDLVVMPGMLYPLTRLQLRSQPSGASVFYKNSSGTVTPATLYLSHPTLLLTWKKPCYQTMRKLLVLRSAKRAASPVFVRLGLQVGVVRRRQRARLFGVLGWAGLGAGLLFGGLAGLFHGLALDAYAQAQDPASVDFQRPKTTNVPILRLDKPVIYREHIGRGNGLRVMGHLGSGLAVAALGTGIGLLIARPRTDRCAAVSQTPPARPKKATP